MTISGDGAADVTGAGGKLRDANGVICDLADARALPGVHNAQNAAAATALALALGVDRQAIARGLLSYPGLPHRQERIATLHGISFVNDSKATNADAASKALASYIDIYWIIGGKAKEGGIESLRAFFPLVVKAYLIGEASDDFARTLEGVVPYEHCGTLEVATERAARDAAASKTSTPVVLLSPACASYDQFANFEARGDAFRGLAQKLAASVQGDAS
jgi:UDP-N-acetylmuramoylalanine--D-glutamate ligase